MRYGVKCAVCGGLFDTPSNNAKYCSDGCKEQGIKLKRKAWEELNPNYNSEAGKVFRDKQKARRMERHQQFLKDKAAAIEKMTGGIFLNE